MPKRSISQRIGDRAEHIAQGAFLTSRNWICRTQTHDFGIDLEAELTTPSDDGEEMSGAILKLQVKGTLKPAYRDHKFLIRVKTDFLRYASQFSTPVILLLVNVLDEKIHYLWVQEYTNGREHLFKDGRSHLIEVPSENELDLSLSGDLPRIALGVTKGAQLMAVQRLIEVFSAKYDYVALNLSADLLSHLGQSGHVSVFNSAVDKLIRRGPHLSRVDAQQFGKVLSEIAKRFGDQLTAEQVLKMVVRGDSYSLAGLDGLSALFDAFPDHACRVALPHLFDQLGLHELSWYCQFRQYHGRLNSVQIWNQIRELDTFFNTGIGVIGIAEKDREYCNSKWPNRGDAVYLQALRVLEPEVDPLAKL